MHAIPIPYRFQYEKCKKKSWELQAYTYTAFVAPLQYKRNFVDCDRRLPVNILPREDMRLSFMSDRQYPLDNCR